MRKKGWRVETANEASYETQPALRIVDMMMSLSATPYQGSVMAAMGELRKTGYAAEVLARVDPAIYLHCS